MRNQEENSGALYTFGIKPTHPATGYRYLEVGEKAAADHSVEQFHVVSFKEKPGAEVADHLSGDGKSPGCAMCGR